MSNFGNRTMTRNQEIKVTAGEITADESANRARLREIGGSQIDNFNRVIVNQALATLWLDRANKDDVNRKVTAAIAVMATIAPRDELEGMLAAQLVACHNASMECYRRAMIPGEAPAYRSDNLEQAAKLTRCYASLLERLELRRGQAAQKKIIVEHRVHRMAPGNRPLNPLLDHPATHMDYEHGIKSINGFKAAGGTPLPLPLEAD